MSDVYERLAKKLENGEITHDEYRRKMDEADERTERAEFFMEVDKREKLNFR